LGALSPAERAAYERHLATCSFCREAVADISALPDLLSRLDAKEFAKLLDPTLTAGDHPGASLRDLAAPPATKGKRRKAFGVRVLSTVAAAILVGLIGIGVLAFAKGGGGSTDQLWGPAVAMTRVEGTSPVTATLRMAGNTGGTKVELQCAYHGQQPATFRLIAYGPDDEQEQIGSWTGAPGTDFRMDGATHFAAGNLSRLEVVQSNGNPLLAYDVP
jgi:anti-sigma factor RsiW